MRNGSVALLVGSRTCSLVESLLGVLKVKLKLSEYILNKIRWKTRDNLTFYLATQTFGSSDKGILWFVGRSEKLQVLNYSSK